MNHRIAYAAAAALALIAACGSDGGTTAVSEAPALTAIDTVVSDATAPPTSAPGSTVGPATTTERQGPATGEPILIGSIAPEGTSAANYPDVRAAIEAGITAVNEAGGVGREHRPLKLVYCNEQNDPNAAAACARELVAQGVMATVRDAGLTNGAQVSEILREANVAEVFVGVNDPVQYAMDNVFPLGGSTSFEFPGMVQWAVEQYDAKNLVVARIDSPGTVIHEQIIAHSAANLGADVAASIAIPSDAADYAPYAAEMARYDPDAVLLVLPTAMYAPVLQAMNSAGMEDVLTFVHQGAMSEATLNDIGPELTDGLLSVTNLPPIGATEVPAVAEFIADVQAEFDQGDENADPAKATGLALIGWLGVHVIAQVAADLETLDSRSFLAALQNAKGLDVKGLVTDWSPGAQGPIPGFDAVVIFTSFVAEAEGGSWHVLSADPIDSIKAIEGFAPGK